MHDKIHDIALDCFKEINISTLTEKEVEYKEGGYFQIPTIRISDGSTF